MEELDTRTAIKMKILILGAGQVGSTVAESLVSEANDITVVDTHAEKLRLLQDRFDLRTLVGNASHPSTLKQAGIADADILLAVTQSDEVNMVACKLASSLYNTPVKIARIRASGYLDHPEIFNSDNFCVDFSICPEQILTDYIRKLIEFPEALQVLEFANGLVSLVAVKAFDGGPLVGKPLSFLHSNMPQIDARVAAIFRQDKPIIPEGATIVQEGDEIFFIAATGNIRSVLKELRHTVTDFEVWGGLNSSRAENSALGFDTIVANLQKTYPPNGSTPTPTPTPTPPAKTITTISEMFVVSTGANTDKFVVGSDNAIWWKRNDAKWQSLGGIAYAGTMPTAAYIGADNVLNVYIPGYVYIPGTARAIYNKSFDGTTWSAPWKNVENQLQ